MSDLNSGDLTGNPRFPWQIERKPMFTLNLSWGWIICLIIIAIIIIIVLWLFTGGKKREFIGIPHFNRDNRPSDILDEETMNFLNIRDPLTPHPENIHNVGDLVDGEVIGHSYPTDSMVNNNRASPIISRSIRNSHIIGNSVEANILDEPNVVYSERYSESQPAEIILTNGNVVSYDHLTPRIENSQLNPVNQLTPQSTNIEELLSNSDIDSSILTESNDSDLVNETINPFITIGVGNSRPQNPTPRYDDIGKFVEKRSRGESRGENICRQFMERYYGKPFKNTRPDFLKNPLTNRNLELDGYNAELALAFEYNGVQHYRFPNYFHKNEEEFDQQLRRDNYKKDVCNQAGVYLINIPYLVPHAQIPDYIKALLPHNR